jgi:hypothetical protein
MLYGRSEKNRTSFVLLHPVYLINADNIVTCFPHAGTVEKQKLKTRTQQNKYERLLLVAG